MFKLDPQLAADTVLLGDLPLCHLLLMNDQNYPWFILVPRKAEVVEVFQLGAADQQVLWQETTTLAALLKDVFNADKINIGALGNVVSQLHVHVIVRHKTDPAWPQPVWGKHPAVPYTAEQIVEVKQKLKTVLPSTFNEAV